jgi:hypothetical protein
MSWHFSQAMEAEFLAASCWDGEQSAPLRSPKTPGNDSWPAKTTAACDLSRSGTTCAPLTGSHGLDVWMLYLAASHAKTSALPEKERGSPASDQGSGVSLLESFARFDRATSSWKTPQLSLLGDLEQFSETWPRWGLMRDGVCLEQMKPPSRLIAERSRLSTTAIESGSWVADRAPTPTVCGNYNRKGASPTSGDGLATWVKQRLPTPIVHDSKAMGPSELNRKSPCLAAMVKWPKESQQPGGPLNPEWVEWLMGWPIGWTALEALETGRFQQWKCSHGRR